MREFLVCKFGVILVLYIFGCNLLGNRIIIILVFFVVFVIVYIENLFLFVLF